jgi:protoheme IX farnesyltransferase
MAGTDGRLPGPVDHERDHEPRPGSNSPEGNGRLQRVPTSSPVPIHETAVTRPSATPVPARPAGAASARPAEMGWARARAVLGAYVALTKPRIIELLLVTTVPTMILAERGLPSFGLVLATLVGGAAAAGSANVLNCYLDRDIDALMNRTKRRPLVTGEVTPRAALVFGLALGVLSLAWFALVVNAVSALLTAAAILVYVVGYTMILKRRTSQNIVWGGIAGCMPVLIGWSAVTGSMSWAAVALFGVIFFWTPPHYWPLSMKFRRDYAAAGVPMLPVVAGDRRVAGEVIGYAVAMVACSLALVPLASMTWVYAVLALGLGAWFLAACVGLYRRAQLHDAGGSVKLGEMRLFHLSITYLTLLFLAVAVDPFLPF